MSKSKKKKSIAIPRDKKKQKSILAAQYAGIRSLKKKREKLEANNKIDPKEKKQRLNELLNEGVERNTIINRIYDRRGKDRYNKITKAQEKKNLNLVIDAKVWEKDKIEDFVFDSGMINNLNGLSISHNDSEILDLLNDVFNTKMGSDSYLRFSIDKKDKATFAVVSEKDIDLNELSEPEDLADADDIFE